MLAQPKGQVIIYGLRLGGSWVGGEGGGEAGVVGGFVDLGLNTVRYSRSHLQMLFNLSDPPSYLYNFRDPPSRPTFLHLYSPLEVYYLLFYKKYFQLLCTYRVTRRSLQKSLIIHVFFWSGTRYLMPVDKPAISKSYVLENCKVHTVSEYLVVHQVPFRAFSGYSALWKG